MSEIKVFFNEWCQKSGKVPNFNIRAAGRKQALRFICELNVPDYLYIGMGNSTNKKNAQTNAVKDFVQFLIRTGELNESDLPKETPPISENEAPVKNEPITPGTLSTAQSNRSVFQPGESPDTMGVAYRPTDGNRTYLDIIADQKKKVEEAEELDMNAGIHGNWTLENCKQRLHEFMQANRLKADYKYSLVGSAVKSYVCELSFFIRQLNRHLSARESASNKQLASRTCALSLVRQLFHLGVIEPFTGSGGGKKKNASTTTKPFDVRLSPRLEADVNELLRELDIVPNPIDDNVADNNDEPVSLISSKVLEEFVSTKPQSAGIVSWSPPQPNWNPWLGSNIDEGKLASSTLEEISVELNNDWKNRLQTDDKLRRLYNDRKSLPIASMKSTIMNSINENSVTIIRGNTGCGKTTQVCQYVLDDFLQSEQAAYCNIVVTQPRRISAVSVAERIAAERGEIIGNSVGYSVRFDSVFPRPYGGILFCTVGVLLRKLERGLRGVSHIIVDEIHERDANTDFILIVLRDMVHTYPDIRLVLMSATVDTSLFKKYFNDCPLVQLEGSCYPVTEYFLEDVVQLLDYDPPYVRRTNKKTPKNSNDNRRDEQLPDAEVVAEDVEEDNLNLFVSDKYPSVVRERVSRMNEGEPEFDLIASLLKYIKHNEKPGAVLVFLPGWNLIFGLMRYLTHDPTFKHSDTVIIPLHSQLPKFDQQKVFEPVANGVRKIILSTNVAETSITINDVVHVIDAGKVKIRLFTAHNNMTSYVTTWASKSNLEQRKGRAGRVCPGVCYHLLSKARFDKLDEHLTPEIFRIPLHEVALSIKLLRLGAIGQFLSKAIESPPIDAVIEAEVTLRDMRCLDANDELTPLGTILARLPIEPRLGRMIILGVIFNVGDALTVIGSYCSTFSEIFLADHRLTGQQRALAGNRHSDHLAALNVFQKFSRISRRFGEEGEVNFCEDKQLNLPSLRITAEAKRQLVDLIIKNGFPEDSLTERREYNVYDSNNDDENLDTVVAILCSGMYPNVCYYQDKRKVLTMGCKFALIHKLSVNCTNYSLNLPSPFFVFDEKLRTKAITCKQTTSVTAIHLLLFGSRKVEYIVRDDLIRMDGWINLKMNPKTAASIVALRPAIDSLIVKTSLQPDTIEQLSPVDAKIIHVVRQLCRINAGLYELEKPCDNSSRNRFNIGRNYLNDEQRLFNNNNNNNNSNSNKRKYDAEELCQSLYQDYKQKVRCYEASTSSVMTADLSPPSYDRSYTQMPPPSSGPVQQPERDYYNRIRNTTYAAGSSSAGSSNYNYNEQRGNGRGGRDNFYSGNNNFYSGNNNFYPRTWRRY